VKRATVVIGLGGRICTRKIQDTGQVTRLVCFDHGTMQCQVMVRNVNGHRIVPYYQVPRPGVIPKSPDASCHMITIDLVSYVANKAW
jgi:hypothetical protein